MHEHRIRKSVTWAGMVTGCWGSRERNRGYRADVRPVIAATWRPWWNWIEVRPWSSCRLFVSVTILRARGSVGLRLAFCNRVAGTDPSPLFRKSKGLCEYCHPRSTDACPSFESQL